MKVSPEVEAVVGMVFIAFSVATIVVAVWYPKHLDHPFIRPRWFGAGGPRAGRFGSVVGSIFWLAIGVLLVIQAFQGIA